MTAPLTIAALGVTMPDLLVSAMIYAAVVLVPVCVIGYLIHFLLSLPMRRRERARFFLDLLETALKRGDSPERALVEMAATEDHSLGVRFHLLAAHLEEGASLEEALEGVPRLVPPQVGAILKAGQRLGNLRSVLPACRQIIDDSHSSVRSAGSYVVVLLLSFSPLAILLTWMLYLFVVPKFQQIMADMAEGGTPLLTFLWAHPFYIIVPQLAMLVALVVGAFFYLGGPRVVGWLQFGIFPIADWIAWRVPWKQQRLQRTFSVVLSALLDGGMPEADALTLAAECTANQIVRRRAASAVRALASGVKLSDAVAGVDPHGEFRWRLKNAAHAGAGGFLRALKGWHEALEARAFRGEQTAAHLVTSGFVVMNGLLVAALALAMFGSLVAIINAGVLW